MSVSPEKTLESLLHELFDADEFRVFLRGFHDGEKLVAALTGKNASTELLFSDAVAALKRRGMLDADFFSALNQERPKRKADIARVMQAWGTLSSATALSLAPNLQGMHTIIGSPRVEVFLADGRDGFLSEARWRPRADANTMDLVALVYDPNGAPVGPPSGVVIGTYWRSEPTTWRFRALTIPTGEGHTGGNSSSEENAREDLLDAVAMHAPRIREVAKWTVTLEAPHHQAVVRDIEALPKAGDEVANVLDYHRRKVLRVVFHYGGEGKILLELGEPLAPEGAFNPLYGPVRAQRRPRAIEDDDVEVVHGLLADFLDNKLGFVQCIDRLKVYDYEKLLPVVLRRQYSYAVEEFDTAGYPPPKKDLSATKMGRLGNIITEITRGAGEHAAPHFVKFGVFLVEENARLRRGWRVSAVAMMATFFTVECRKVVGSCTASPGT